MHFSRFDLNQLITEVVDLYRVQDSAAELKLLLDPAAAEHLRGPDADPADPQQSGHQFAGGARGPAGRAASRSKLTWPRTVPSRRVGGHRGHRQWTGLSSAT
jgi:hypothetical protein